jgi:hypothetical protein
MRRSASLLLAVGVLVAGCAVQPFTAGDASPSPSSSPDPEGPVGTAPASIVPDPAGTDALRETPNPAVVDPHPTAVDRFAIGPDGRTVVVFYWGGSQACFGLQRVDVANDSSGPTTITVFEGTLPEVVGMACDMIAVLKSAVVTLDAAIVVDTAQPEPTAGEPDLTVEPAIVEVSDRVENPIPVTVTGYEVSGNGTSLTVQFWGGIPECYGVATASVETSADPWTVSIREGHVPGAEVCIELAVAKAIVVILDQQLLRDGSVTG